jgi:ribosomal RNA-processing protein 1
MDKYLYLVRQYLHVSFRYLAKAGWKDLEMIDEFMAVLSNTPLNVRDAKIPNGMRYHILDIYLDELEKVDDEDEVPAEKLLAPFMVLQKKSPTKTVRERAKSLLQDDRVRKWLGLEDAVETAGKENKEAQTNGRNEDKVDGSWDGFED